MDDKTLAIIENLTLNVIGARVLTGGAQTEEMKRIYIDTTAKHGPRIGNYAALLFTLQLFGGTQVSTIINTGGGSITSSNIGGGAIWAQNISSTSSVVENSRNISSEMKTAIRNAVDFVSQQNLPDDQKEDATTHLKRIAEQLDKTKADEGIVKRSIDTLTKMFSTAASVGALASAIYKLFGWATGV